MPRVNTFRYYDLPNQAKKKQTLTINNYLGVDYNTSQLSVADNHAIDMLNFIYKDKVNQKRHGWQQLFQMIPTVYYTRTNGVLSEAKSNPINFNGIWSFVGNDNQIHIVAHIGYLLYIITGLGKGKTFLDCKFTLIAERETIGGQVYLISKELMNIKSQAFYGNKRLYILGGNKYYVLNVSPDVELREVEDDIDTYIPTTTIGIVAKGTLGEGESSLSRATSLDDVNMMTQYRKNKLISGTYIESSDSVKSTRFNDYELDTCVYGKKDTDINNIVITINSLRKESD